MIDLAASVKDALANCPIPERAVYELAAAWKFYFVALRHGELYRTRSSDPVVVRMVEQLNGLDPEDDPYAEYAQHSLYLQYSGLFAQEDVWSLLQAFYAAYDRRWTSSGVYSHEYLAAERALNDLLGGQIMVTRGVVLTSDMLDSKGRVLQEVLDADRLTKALQDSNNPVNGQVVHHFANLWRLRELAKLTQDELHEALMPGSCPEDTATYDLLSNMGATEERTYFAEVQIYFNYLSFFGTAASNDVTHLLDLWEDLANDAHATGREDEVDATLANVNRHTGAHLHITSGVIVVLDDYATLPLVPFP